MTSGNNKPFMTYQSSQDILQRKKKAKKMKLPIAQIIREAVTARLSDGNPYNTGFNDGLQKAIHAVAGIQASQMRFPSGRSFAELVEEEVVKHQIKDLEHEAAGTEKPMPVL